MKAYYTEKDCTDDFAGDEDEQENIEIQGIKAELKKLRDHRDRVDREIQYYEDKLKRYEV